MKPDAAEIDRNDEFRRSIDQIAVFLRESVENVIASTPDTFEKHREEIEAILTSVSIDLGPRVGDDENPISVLIDGIQQASEDPPAEPEPAMSETEVLQLASRMADKFAQQLWREGKVSDWDPDADNCALAGLLLSFHRIAIGEDPWTI